MLTRLERLQQKFTVDSGTGCWVWHGCKDKKGYGLFKMDDGNMTAHRAAYTLLVGPIPKGLVIDHLCRNPSCVNPDHLDPVTQKENCNRGMIRVAVAKRVKRQTHCKYGHPLSGENLRMEGRRRRCRQCGRDRALAHYYRHHEENKAKTREWHRINDRRKSGHGKTGHLDFGPQRTR